MKRYNEYMSRISMVKIHAENAKKAGLLDFDSMLAYLKSDALIKNEALTDGILTDDEKDVIEYVAEKVAFDINELYEEELEK